MVSPITLAGEDALVIVWRDITADRDLVVERERLANTDPLTGLINRRGAEHELERELARSRRDGASLSVALLDIDRFKQINDSYGHDAGDAALVAVAGLLTAQARITDVIVRWGGEEFLAILPGELAGAVAFCERVRGALAGVSFAHGGAVTVSAGVAELAIGESPAAAITRADARLYQAKRDGRDRVLS